MALSLPPQRDGRGGVRIWLANEFVNRLGALRGPGESYSDVIIRSGVSSSTHCPSAVCRRK
jgi:hypothetical protein